MVKSEAFLRSYHLGVFSGIFEQYYSTFSHFPVYLPPAFYISRSRGGTCPNVASNHRARHEAPATNTVRYGINSSCTWYWLAVQRLVCCCRILPHVHPFLSDSAPPSAASRLSPGFLPVACATRPPFPRLSPRRLRYPAAFPPCRKARAC